MVMMVHNSRACVRTCIQEAVQRRDLGRWQFKALNAGIALASFAHVMALYEWWHGGDGGPWMPAVLGAWAFAGAAWRCAHLTLVCVRDACQIGSCGSASQCLRQAYGGAAMAHPVDQMRKVCGR